MIYYDEDKYIKKPFDDDLIYEIEGQYNIKCLFGGAISSKSFGIDNIESDLDFNLFFVGEKSSFCVMMDEADFNMINYQSLMNQILNNENNKYPTILFRTGNENINKFDQLRNDYFSSQKIIELLFSNFIWDSGYLKENVNNLLNKIDILQAVDYYYTRAYGNLKNHLSNKKAVECKRVLRCFIGCCCMQQLLKEKVIPNMNIDYLISNYSENKYKNYLLNALKTTRESGNNYHVERHRFDFGTDDIMSLNKEVANSSNVLMEKTEPLIDPDRMFNHAIENWLIELAHDIQKMDVSKFRIELGTKCFYSKVVRT